MGINGKLNNIAQLYSSRNIISQIKEKRKMPFANMMREKYYLVGRNAV
jgi:hypothetical protein